MFFKCYTKSIIVDIHLFSKEIPLASVPALRNPMLDECLSFSWPGMLQPRGTKGSRPWDWGQEENGKVIWPSRQVIKRHRRTGAKSRAFALSECPSVSLRWQALKTCLGLIGHWQWTLSFCVLIFSLAVRYDHLWSSSVSADAKGPTPDQWIRISGVKPRKLYIEEARQVILEQSQLWNHCHRASWD